MNEILIVKTSSLGDIIHTFPVIAYLRKQFPAAKIDWVVETPFAELVQAHPEIDRVLTISTRSWRKALWKLNTWKEFFAFRKKLKTRHYDAVFDFQGNIKSGLVVSQARCKNKIGFKKTVAEWPNRLFTNIQFDPQSNGNIRDDYLALPAAFLQDSAGFQSTAINLTISQEQRALLYGIKEAHKGLLVMVCPGSAWPNKQLSQETLQAFLSLLMNELNCTFLFGWGSADEKRIAEELYGVFKEQSRILEKYSVPVLQNLMGLCDLVIAADSLPLHLAGTTNTPSFSVFGPSSASKYKPVGENHFALQGTCPYGRSFSKRCPILRTCKTGACIQDLKSQEIFEAFKSWWRR